MSRLTKVGWGSKPDEIERSVKEGIEDFRIPLSKKDPDINYITFENVTFDRDKSAESSITIKESVTFNKSILTKIYGDVVEYDGGRKKVLARNLQIGQLPQLIEGRSTFIVTGSEYNLVNQPRRKSSTYVHNLTGQKGGAVADFNLSKGRNFTISLNPDSGKVMMNVGGSSIALRPLLESVGMTRDDLVRATSYDFARENWDSLDTTQALLNNYRRLYGKLYEYKQEDVRKMSLPELKKDCEDYFKQTSVDQQTTKYLYNEGFKRVDKRFMEAILTKFYKVNNAEEPGVDPDDLYYQKIYPPNMLFKDRISKVQGEIANQVRFKLKLGHAPENIFRNIFAKYLISMVNSSDLSRLDPQYNPIGIYTASTKVSPIGMGGIGDIRAVTRAKRGVHSSYMGVIDPTSSAQGMNVGVQLNLTDDVSIDDEGEIYLPLKKWGSQTTSHVKIADTFDKKLMLPRGEGDKDRFAMYKGKVEKLSTNEKPDYEFSRGTESIFGSVNQLVPFPQATQGNRSFMTSRQVTQALPLKYGDAPHVVPVTQDGQTSFRKLRKNLESLVPLESPVSGVVMSANDGIIKIRQDSGDIYKFQYHEHLPFATNTGLHQVPIVKIGDRVRKGQMLVKDGYTADNGELAIGKNLRVAFMPYYGDNTEDSVVITETAADKMTSMHYHTYDTKISDTYVLNKSKFRKLFGDKYEGKLDFDKYDDNGLLKKGEEATSEMPVILIIEKRTPDERISTISKISNKVVVDLVDGSKLYNGSAKGVVVDSAIKPRFASITLVSEERAIIGDKITGLYGNKATISTILPDDQMIQDEAGNPVDMLHSSTTVVSRMNPGQVYENALGKIVRKTGKRYKVPIALNPTKDDLSVFVNKELKKYGIKDKERVYNPITKKHIERPIAVGEMYTLKLLKVDKDMSARGIGPGYSSSGAPSKGGKQGAKSIGAAEMNALVGHNARTFLTDAGNIKSQKNDEYWKNMEMGMPNPTYPTSQTWEKTKGLMTAAGGYITQDNSSVNMMPVTDKITNMLAGHRTIQTPALLNSKNLEPMKKGLFDTAVTGGISGKLWSKLELEDGIISPLTQDHLRLVLGKSKSEMDDWQAKLTQKEMVKELDKIDVPKRVSELLRKSKDTDLTSSEIKELRFLKNIKDSGMKLRDLVITKIPVPPPIHRPVTKLEDGGLQISDINLFYKDIMLANEGLKGVKGTPFAREAKKVLLDNVGALVGTNDSNNVQLKKKGSRGLLPYFGGVGSPKNGYIFSTLLKKNQDLSGRSRIIADSDMSMDEIGVPEKMAWKMFEPHIIKELRGMGYTPLDAIQAMKDKTDVARKALEAVAGKTNVLYNRNPTLHRNGMLAARPIIVKDSSIHLNLPATKPLNADFDGDAMQIHVPSNERVSRSLNDLMLSKNVFSDETPGSLSIGFHTETLVGLYQMSVKDPSQFRKDIRMIIGSDIPIAVPMTKKESKALLAEVARKFPDTIAEKYDKLRRLGERYATDIGSTVGVDDVAPLTKERDKIVSKYKYRLASEKDPIKRATILQDMQNDARGAALKHKGDLTMLVKSGAKGSDMQLAGMLVSPMLSYDPDNPVNTAVLTKRSYSEGLDFNDFWNQNIKVKKDAIGTALNVALPGSLGKLMVYNTYKEVISMKDCGTDAGVELPWNSKDLAGRVLQESVPGLKKGTVLVPSNLKKLPKRNIKVRSPRTCAAEEGICQMCYGTDSYWNFYDIGTHVGIRASNAVIEPISQMALNSKHGGRDITSDIGGGGLDDLSALFSSNSDKSNVATLAERKDKVESVEGGGASPFRIAMDSGTKYKLHPDSKIIVKKGDRVKTGDPLSKGLIPYTDMTRLKGTKAGRDTLVSEFKKLGGDSVNERLYDTIAKGAVNYVQVLSPFEGYIPGDNIPYNKILNIGEKRGLSVKVSELAPGMILAQELLDLSAAHMLTEDDVDDIKASGRKAGVLVFPKDVRVKPVVKSFYTSGMLEDNWLENLGQKYIRKTLTTAASEGKSSPTESLSPVPAWLLGRPFNEKGPKF